MSPKPSVVCPLCSYDDYLESFALPDHVWDVTCSGPGHDPYTWSPTPEHPTGPIAEGLAAELDLFGKLVPLLRTDSGFDEYGVVEYRFGDTHPKEYAVLLKTYGHRAQGPGRHYTLSAFLAGVLKQLHHAGEIGLTQGAATGYWDYLDEVSYWSGVTDADRERRRTWVEFASALGLDPRSWPHVQQP